MLLNGEIDREGIGFHCDAHILTAAARVQQALPEFIEERADVESLQIIGGSSWVSGWWTFGRDEVRVDWLRGDLSIDPGASHVLVIPGEPLVAD